MSKQEEFSLNKAVDSTQQRLTDYAVAPKPAQATGRDFMTSVVLAL